MILWIGLIVVTGLTGCQALGQEFGGAPDLLADAPDLPAGDPALGRIALQEYGCHSCHVIPGVPGADSWVGPPLTAWAERTYIAGTLPNEPQYLVEWIRFPQAIEPGTAMPNMGVPEEDAVHMGAYLYTLRSERGWNWVGWR
jgi:cytochrome c2